MTGMIVAVSHREIRVWAGNINYTAKIRIMLEIDKLFSMPFRQVWKIQKHVMLKSQKRNIKNDKEIYSSVYISPNRFMAIII